MHEGARPTAGVRAAGSREPRSLVSTRLTRELIAADALSDLERDEPAARPARLLDAVLDGMRASLGALLQYAAPPGPGVLLAARGVADSAVDLLTGRAGGESLALRACAERRVFLLDRASREPLMSALRGESPDLASVAVVPLYDRGLPVAALAIGASDAAVLHAAALRLLSPAFHLLGILLSSARTGAFRAEDAAAPAADSERYLVEIEELGNLLREAREALRGSEERAAASEAAQRAEVESYRSRVGELEASCSRGDLELSMLRDLESAYAEQTRKLEDRSRRIAELEDELGHFRLRLAALERERDADAGVGAVAAEEEVAPQLDRAGETDDLQEIADLAAAALGCDDDSMLPEPVMAEAEPFAELAEDEALASAAEQPAAEEHEAPPLVIHSLAEPISPNGSHSAIAAPAESEAVAPLVVLAIESDGDAGAAVRTAAGHVRAHVWFGAGDRPAGRSLLAVNLFDRGLETAPGLLDSSELLPHGVAYGYDVESGSGLAIGKSTWLARPLDVQRSVQALRACVRGKIHGILIVSSQLRELAPLRDALSTGGIASSVACDARQALDLLEIVRRPDALLVDLALADGGLAVAAQCRAQEEMRSVPILLLLPERPDPERLLASARRSGILAPFAAPDIARVLSETLLEI